MEAHSVDPRARKAQIYLIANEDVARRVIEDQTAFQFFRKVFPTRIRCPVGD